MKFAEKQQKVNQRLSFSQNEITEVERKTNGQFGTVEWNLPLKY